MESKIAKAVNLKYNPVAIYLTNEKPENTLQFKKGRVGCVMSLFANAARGKTAAVDADTYGCSGAGYGLGFGDKYLEFPGGIECFYNFLSSGNMHSEKGKVIANNMEGKASKEFVEYFREGERFVKTPELVKQWHDEMPRLKINSKYVLFKSLSEVQCEIEIPEIVILLANPDQLSALVILANYDREGRENVIIPWAAGCQLIGLLPLIEAKSEKPRAIVGLTDISAREEVRKLLGSEYLSFAIPWKMFLEMESNVEGSFLERPSWLSLISSNHE